MDQESKDKILSNLTHAETIFIAATSGLGFDGLAAGLALYLSLIKLDKNVRIAAQTPSVGDAQRLYAVDRVDSQEAGKNPVIVVENAIETVDKVTYFLDGTKLKVVIHPLPGTPEITKDQISLEYTIPPANLIFSLGFTNLHDLRSEITHEQQIDPESWIINVNNQIASQRFAQVEVVDQESTSISEVTAKMIQDLALPIDEDIAYNLYSGIAQATSNYSPAQTTPKTFEIAAWLIKFGAGRASLAREPEEESLDHTFAGAQQAKPLTPTSSLSTSTNIPVPSPSPITPKTDLYERTPTIEEVETKAELPISSKSPDWLKPPKIYKGSKSFNGENKG